jgi:chemotaxis protein MotB
VSDSQEKWRTTFNDLMTLLMVFFVLLFSLGGMSKGNEARFLNKLQSGLGLLKEGSMTAVGVVEPIFGVPMEDREQLEVMAKAWEMERHLEGLVGELNAAVQGSTGSLSKDIEGILTPEGMRVRVGGDLMFASGEAELSAEAKRILGSLGDFLNSISNDIVVEGHTDNVPIMKKRFPSNWELSVARATNVVRYLVEIGISPKRLAAVGYGETRPLYPNDTEEHKAKNRRVEILILK